MVLEHQHLGGRRKPGHGGQHLGPDLRVLHVVFLEHLVHGDHIALGKPLDGDASLAHVVEERTDAHFLDGRFVQPHFLGQHHGKYGHVEGMVVLGLVAHLGRHDVYEHVEVRKKRLGHGANHFAGRFQDLGVGGTDLFERLDHLVHGLFVALLAGGEAFQAILVAFDGFALEAGKFGRDRGAGGGPGAFLAFAGQTVEFFQRDGQAVGFVGDAVNVSQPQGHDLGHVGVGAQLEALGRKRMGQSRLINANEKPGAQLFHQYGVFVYLHGCSRQTRSSGRFGPDGFAPTSQAIRAGKKNCQLDDFGS